MRKTASLDAAYFEGLYRDRADPWDFATSDYEADKYAATVGLLGEERAHRGLEIGCSIGVLTRLLAARCDRLVATEVSAVALDQARARCADLGNVRFRLTAGVDEAFDAACDLIVLSEVVYYWDDADLARVAEGVARILRPGGRVLLAHYVLETDYPKSGDDAVEALWDRLAGRLVSEARGRAAAYRLDLWRRPWPA